MYDECVLGVSRDAEDSVNVTKRTYSDWRVQTHPVLWLMNDHYLCCHGGGTGVVVTPNDCQPGAYMGSSRILVGPIPILKCFCPLFKIKY